MHMEARELPTGGLEPVMVDVPVLHHGRQIATAEVSGRGQIKITVSDPFDQNGIFQILSLGTASALTIETVIKGIEE